MAEEGTLASPENWAITLRQKLGLFGHRNWIGVVDAAYPTQSSPGIEMISTGAPAPEVFATLISALENAPHVRPVVHTDAELAFVAVEDAPGVASYRHYLKAVLAPFPVRTMEHEQIIAHLAHAARDFRILLLKTTLLIPYSSVFFDLQCGYWSNAAEERMRSAIADHAASSGKITLL
jgi:hypothetical protein